MIRVVDRFENLLMHCDFEAALRLLSLGLARWHLSQANMIILCRGNGRANQADLPKVQGPIEPLKAALKLNKLTALQN